MRKAISAYLVFATLFLTMMPALIMADESATTTEPLVSEKSESLDADIENINNNEDDLPADMADDIQNATTTDGINEVATTTEPVAEDTAAATSTVESDAAMDATTTLPAAEIGADTESATSTVPVMIDATTTEPLAAATSSEDYIDPLSSEPLSNGPLASGASSNPEPAKILVQWEMTADGLDDSSADFFQLNPAGIYNGSREFKICAIVDDPAQVNPGATTTTEVWGQMFYPTNASFGPTDAKNRQGCGQAVGAPYIMERMAWSQGYNLFCENIQNNNKNLAKFIQVDAITYNYDNLCGPNGRLMEDRVGIYCADQTLAYDDISGDYAINITAQGADNNIYDGATDKMTYLALTSFEIDFDNIDYGSVKENSEAAALGDDIWNPENLTRATIRNVGNTRLNVSIWQDDMGLGESELGYNIRYRARMAGGNNNWKNYAPLETATLDNALDLSQQQPLDFSTTVAKYLTSSQTRYQGQMDIDAQPVPHYECVR